MFCHVEADRKEETDTQKGKVHMVVNDADVYLRALSGMIDDMGAIDHSWLPGEAQVQGLENPKPAQRKALARPADDSDYTTLQDRILTYR